MPKYSDIQIKQGLLSSDSGMIRYVFYEQFTPMLRFNAQKAAGNKSVPFDDLVQELYLYMSRNDWEKLIINFYIFVSKSSFVRKRTLE